MSDPREAQTEPEVIPEDAPEVDEPEEDTEPAENEEPHQGEDVDLEGDADPAPEAPAARSSARDRIRQLNERARRAERERDEALLLARERERTAPQPKRETPEEREARLAMLDPDTRHRVEIQEVRDAATQGITRLERITMATADRNTFENLCIRKPHFERIADDVERMFQDIFRGGGYQSREVIAKFILGDRADKAAAAAATKQRRAGREKITRETVTRRATGSDVRAERQREDSKTARIRRLENLKF